MQQMDKKKHWKKKNGYNKWTRETNEIKENGHSKWTRDHEIVFGNKWRRGSAKKSLEL
jgi:hypothetical protein